jgi:hypothetical protein
MNAALENLICAVPELGPCLCALDGAAAGGNPHARSLRGAIEWVVEQPDRTVEEKLVAIGKLIGPPFGFMHIASMRGFLGWDEPGAARVLQ